MQFLKSDYKEYPKTLSPDDLWGQVRRTVNGKPVSEEQIAMIVSSIKSSLALKKTDRVLDLACGNGALSSYLFEDCASLFGVDFSDYLIQIATSRFSKPPQIEFVMSDAASYVKNEPTPEKFNKVLCYGSFSFFTKEDAQYILQTLHDRFVKVESILIGNLPDRDRAHLFYEGRQSDEAELDDPFAQIGIWRSQQQLESLALSTGWKLQIIKMPAAFYASHYRFDALLERL